MGSSSAGSKSASKGERLRVLGDAAERVAPTTLAAARRLDVAPALTHVLPNGLQRGSTVGVRGQAAVSLGLALAAGPVASGSWVATVGCEELCLVAAEQAGVELQRMVLVAQPPRSAWGAVVAALVDAFDIVMISSGSATGSYKAGVRDARRLLSHARERGNVIIDVGGVWPEAHDIVLEVSTQQWSGLGHGHGVLTARQVLVEVSGRRGATPRQVPLWLPGEGLGPQAIDPASVASQSSDEVVPLRPVPEGHKSSGDQAWDEAG